MRGWALGKGARRCSRLLEPRSGRQPSPTRTPPAPPRPVSRLTPPPPPHLTSPPPSHPSPSPPPGEEEGEEGEVVVLGGEGFSPDQIKQAEAAFEERLGINLSGGWVGGWVGGVGVHSLLLPLLLLPHHLSSLHACNAAAVPAVRTHPPPPPPPTPHTCSPARQGGRPGRERPPHPPRAGAAAVRAAAPRRPGARVCGAPPRPPPDRRGHQRG